MRKLTRRDALKVRDVIDAGLTSGLGVAKPGQMCVMAAINYALGGDHNDEPDCVHPIIRAFDIRLNDSKWSSDTARAKGMRREAIAKLGSSEIDGAAWLDYVITEHIKRIVPIPLKVVAKLIPAHSEALLAATTRCEKDGDHAAAYAARAAAYAAYAAADAAADAAARAAAYAAADAAAYAAARAAADAAAYAAADAARAAADAARAAADAAAYTALSPDEILTLSAEIATEACIKFNTQGSEWLDIVDEEK